jgi:hypothetical protein
MNNHDLQITVTYSHWDGPSHPENYHVSAVYGTKAERDAALAQHPKSMQLKTGEETCRNTGATKFCIKGMGSLKPTKGNVLNETAQRRLAHLLDHLEYRVEFGNSYATADEVRAACF